MGYWSVSATVCDSLPLKASAPDPQQGGPPLLVGRSKGMARTGFMPGADTADGHVAFGGASTDLPPVPANGRTPFAIVSRPGGRRTNSIVLRPGR